MIVVKLGGTNGSGKTSVARALMDTKMPFTMDPSGLLYRGKINGLTWAILGKYKTVCGGMDTISDKEKRLELINDAIADKHNDVVFFEGLITGKTYGKIGELSEMDNGAEWIYAFMDTPFEVCVGRVLHRRLERGNTAPFNAERTMRPTYRAVASVARKAATQGHAVIQLPYSLPPKALAGVLVEAVERMHANMGA